MNFRLQKENTGLIIIDVQERLFGHVERAMDVLHQIKKVISGFQMIGMPIVVTEQYPEKMGPTLASLREQLGDDQEYLSKTTFSCLGNEEIRNKILSMPQTQWVIVGIEAHVCILQTVKDLTLHNQEVVVLNDAITSRSIYDFSTAIAEMRDCGVRISSLETILFEIVADSKSPDFKAISQLIK